MRWPWLTRRWTARGRTEPSITRSGRTIATPSKATWSRTDPVRPDETLVLTYHSISAAPGPTSIPVDTFRAQMAALAEAGYAALTLDQFMAWREGRDGPDRRVLITFDDAFLDFRDAAHPILRE